MRPALKPALAGHQLPAQAVHRRLAQQPAASVRLTAEAAGAQAAAGQGLARAGPWRRRPEGEGDQAASFGWHRRGFLEAWVGQGAAGFCLQVLQGLQGGLEASVGVQATAQGTLMIASQLGMMCPGGCSVHMQWQQQPNLSGYHTMPYAMKPAIQHPATDEDRTVQSMHHAECLVAWAPACGTGGGPGSRAWAFLAATSFRTAAGDWYSCQSPAPLSLAFAGGTGP